MDIQQIRYFLGLADELHFWKSAEKMNLTQSALSRNIKALEDELGLRLFDRDKRNVRLTKAGVFLREEWQRLLAQIDNVHRHAQQISVGEAGSIRIGHPGSVTHSLIPDLLHQVATLYPHLRVELKEIIVMKNADSLLNYQVDVLFTRIPTENPALASRFVSSDPFALVVPEAHSIQAATFTDLCSVKGERFILPAFDNRNPYTELLSAIFQAYDYRPTVIFESDYGSIILSLVAKGLGISLMPISYAVQSPPGVRFIKLNHHSTIYMVWRKDDPNPIIAKLLLLVGNRLNPKVTELGVE